mgnify:FL=1
MNNQRKPQGVPMGRGPMRGAMIVEKPKNGKQTFKKLLKYIGSSKKVFIILLVLTFLVSILSLVGPSLQGDAMGSITRTKDNPEINWESLLLLLIAMVIVYTLQAVFTYFQSLFSAKLSQEMIVKLRNDLFGHISKLPISYVDTHQHGDIMSRMTNDVDKISTTISSSISSLFSGILTIVGVLAITLYLNWFLTLVSMASVVLTIIVVKYLSKAMRKYFKKQQDLLGILNGHSEETITGYKTVIAYSQEKEAMDKFNKISTDLKNVGIKSQILGGVMGPLMNIINNIGFLIVCGVGGYLAATSSTLGGWGIVGYTITISTLSKFILYSKKFSRPINEIANLWSQVQSSMAAAERVFEIMDLPLEVDEGTKHMTDIKGNIKFENIHFSYVEGEEVLKGFNLSVKPGQKIAIVGATGSGKTTVVNLLMRFYDPQEGEITIDGININDIPKQELRKNISIVLQDAVLFETTIKENIKYGNENASDDEVKNSAEMSNASYFIERLPQKYETYLSESGSNLSQGQRQLLTIARTILADPKILILDEATSSVDTRTEKNIQDAMVKLMKNRTSLIIAHRLSTIQDADIIIVVDDGKVVEKGNHKELLNQKGKYYNLYQTQFAGNQI